MLTQEIAVTARKRAEHIQDIPASVTALNAEQLTRNDIGSLEKLSAVSPVLIMCRSPADNGAQLVLRRIGSNATSLGVAQSIALAIDGVYYGQERFINDPLFDLQRMVPLADTFGVRVGVRGSKMYCGYFTNDAAFGGRVALKWTRQSTMTESLRPKPTAITPMVPRGIPCPFSVTQPVSVLLTLRNRVREASRKAR